MMRDKSRWLLIDALGLDATAFPECVDQAVRGFLGVSGASRARARGEATRGVLVVKCASGQEDEVIAALAFKSEFKGKRVALRTLKVSGTLDALL
jgi:RNase P/RNase MRP subunit POP5